MISIITLRMMGLVVNVLVEIASVYVGDYYPARCRELLNQSVTWLRPEGCINVPDPRVS